MSDDAKARTVERMRGLLERAEARSASVSARDAEEVLRLVAELRELRAIARALAAMDPVVGADRAPAWLDSCVLCGAGVAAGEAHRDECPWERARRWTARGAVGGLGTPR